MKHQRWFHALLFLSIVVLTTPALALGPPHPTAASLLPLTKPIGGQVHSLPDGPAARYALGPPRALEPTSPDSPAETLLDEGFEDGIMPPPGGWSTIQSHPTLNWTIIASPHSGSYAAWVAWDVAASDEWLLSPVIDLTSVRDASLDFWALGITAWCPGGVSGADVFLHVTDAGGTPIGTVWNMCSESWEVWEYRLVSVDLSPFDGLQVRLAWQYVGIDGYSFGLDDISLTGGSTDGYVDGYITDANMGLPLENAHLYLSGITDPTFEEATWSNAEGYYVLGPLLAGDYELRAAAYGYQNGNTPLTVTEGMTTTVDFEMTSSSPDLSHTLVQVQVPPDSTETAVLTLENKGTGELVFRISEVPYHAPFPGPAGGLQTPDGQGPSSAMPVGIAPEVYDDLAASPNGTARFVVYLAEQADLSAAFGIDDWSARGHYVLDRLQSVAERTQAGLRATLDREGAVYESRFIVNALVVQGNLTLAEQLVARPEVTGIGPNSQIRAPTPAVLPGEEALPDAIEWNIQKVRADQVWSSFGVTGSGIVVANIDTGVQWDHPALINQYRGNLGGSSYDHNYNWWDPYGDRPDAPEDPHGHGTLTMGIVVGDDGGANQIGVAPGASWFACNGFNNSGLGYEAELLQCAEFILAPWDLTGANPDPGMRADVVNNSWGSGPAQWWYNQVVYAWRAAGIFPVFSAGNDGPTCGTAGDPGDMAGALSVGATDATDNNAPSSAASFSSRGPAMVTGLVKPNVSAPGASIRSSVPGSTYQGGWSGTSVAAPHVTGEVALLWSAQPELRGDVQLTQWVIEQNTNRLLVNQGYFCGDDGATSVPNNQYGWGRIDAYDAVDMALSSNWEIPWLAINPAGGVVFPHTSMAIELAFDTAGLESRACYPGMLKFEYNDPYLIEEFLPVEMCVRQDATVFLPLVVKNR